MSGIIDRYLPFKCPDCGRSAAGVKQSGAEGFNLPEGFHRETRDGVPVIVCTPCGTVAFHPENSN